MSTKCEHCKGTRVEPGEANCTWCDNTGTPCGLGPLRFTKGDTDPVGDCDKFEAGIHVGTWFQRIVAYGDNLTDAEALRDEVLVALNSEPVLREGVAKHWQVVCDQRAKIEALQQRLTAADERADGFDHRVARLRHVGMELMGVIDEYRAMPCDSLKVRMFQTADRYRNRLTAKCGNCEDHGVIGYTTGQTPETFDQGEYPCPECHPTEYAAWSKP